MHIGVIQPNISAIDLKFGAANANFYIIELMIVMQLYI